MVLPLGLSAIISDPEAKAGKVARQIAGFMHADAKPDASEPPADRVVDALEQKLTEILGPEIRHMLVEDVLKASSGEHPIQSLQTTHPVTPEAAVNAVHIAIHRVAAHGRDADSPQAANDLVVAELREIEHDPDYQKSPLDWVQREMEKLKTTPPQPAL